MTSVNSIAGNSGFTKIGNTLVNTTDVSRALDNLGVRPLKAVVGTVTPTAATNYAVVDSAGSNVTLPLGALISHVFLRGSSTLVGGTNAVVSLGPIAAGAVTALNTVAVATADLILGSSPPVAVTVGDAVNSYVSVTTTGVFTAGTIEVTVLYM